MPETSLRGIHYVLVLLIAVAVAYFGFTQEKISIDDGHPYDSQVYYTMAEQVAAGEPISALRPFAYRVALPFLAGSLFPHDIALGFELLNLFFALATVMVFYLYLRSFRLGTDTTLLLVLVLVCASQSPFRFVHFIPAYADPPALFFIVLLLYLGRVIRRLDLIQSLAVAVLSVIGVLFREIALCGLLVFVFTQCFRLWRKPPFLLVLSWRNFGLCALPVLAAGLTLVLMHTLVQGTGAYGYLEQMRGVISRLVAQPDVFLLAWLTSFGVIPFLLLLSLRVSGEFLSENQDVAVFLGGCVLLALFTGFHTDRIVFWSFPAVLLLFGVLLERPPLRDAPISYKLFFLVPLFVIQALAWRVWLPIPDDPQAQLFDPGMPPVLLFSALGDVTLGHVYASTLPAEARLVLLGQFVLAATYFGIVLHLAGGRQSRGSNS